MLVAYFGDFSLRMHSFDHITTSGLNSGVIFEFIAPIFLYGLGFKITLN